MSTSSPTRNAAGHDLRIGGRTDTTYLINSPTGIGGADIAAGSPSPTRGSPPGVSAHQYEKRKQLKQMLARRLQEQYGTDPVKAALIKGVLDECAPLQMGVALSPADFAQLERNVKRAVAAAQGDPRTMLPARSFPREQGRVDYSQDLSAVSDWTHISKHRASFYATQQHREAEQKERQKQELAMQLAHQRSEHDARKRDRKADVAREAARLSALEAEYKAEMERDEAKKRAKMQKELEVRHEQMGQRRAREKVSLRLRQLEDQEVLRELREEQRRAEEAMARKAVEVAEQNELAERENEANQQRKRDAVRAIREDDVRLNRLFAETVEAKERARAEGISALKERIAKQQKSYEDKAGAADKQRREAEEVARKMWEEKHNRDAAERERRNAEFRLRKLAEQTASLEEQIAQHHHAKTQQRFADKRCDAPRPLYTPRTHAR